MGLADPGDPGSLPGADLHQEPAVFAKHPAAIGDDRPDSRQTVFSAVERPQRIVNADLGVEPADRLTFYVGWVGDNYICPPDRRQPVADDEQGAPVEAQANRRSPVRSRPRPARCRRRCRSPGGRSASTDSRIAPLPVPRSTIAPETRPAAPAPARPRPASRCPAAAPACRRRARSRGRETPCARRCAPPARRRPAAPRASSTRASARRLDRPVVVERHRLAARGPSAWATMSRASSAGVPSWPRAANAAAVTRSAGAVPATGSACRRVSPAGAAEPSASHAASRRRAGSPGAR